MQNEQKYDEHSVDSVVQNLNGMVTEIGLSSEDGSGKKQIYPYAKMMNLIEQCRSIESEFRVGKVDIATDQIGQLDGIMELFEKSSKLVQKLKEEKSRFTRHISGVEMAHGSDGVRYVCSKGKCRYSVDSDSAFQSNRAALSVRGRRKKATRYTSLVLNEYINRMGFVSDRLKALLDRVQQENERAKARSENEARAMMENNQPR